MPRFEMPPFALTPNQKAVLQLIRLHGSLPKAELARLTGLTAQAMGQITQKLETLHLLQRDRPVRGRIGQPSVPLSLRPDGAYAIGIKIGRRQTDWLLVDLMGHVQQRHSVHYHFPVAHSLFPHIQTQLERMLQSMGETAQRVLGVGVAAPFMLGGWHELLHVSTAQSQAWNEMDIQQEIQALTTLPVTFVKDTIAACTCELVLGLGRSHSDFVYMNVDTFVGGGVVLGGKIHHGLRGNAGALASLPMNVGSGKAMAKKTTSKSTSRAMATTSRSSTSSVWPTQLLRFASLWELEQRFKAQGLDENAAYDDRALTGAFAPHTEAWLQTAATGLADGAVSAVALLDVDTVVIDGSMAHPLLEKLVKKTEQAFDQFDWEGLWRPQLRIGSIGADAGAIGGALLPLHLRLEP